MSFEDYPTEEEFDDSEFEGSDSVEFFGDEEEPPEPTTEEEVAFMLTEAAWVYAGEEFHWAIEEALDSLGMNLLGFPTWIYCIPLGTGDLRGWVTHDGNFIESFDSQWTDAKGNGGKRSFQITAILER